MCGKLSVFKSGGSSSSLVKAKRKRGKNMSTINNKGMRAV
jgi:hypothetical protein